MKACGLMIHFMITLLVGDHEDIGEDIIQEDLLSRRDSSACPLRENISSVVEKRLGFCPRAFCESFLPCGNGRQTYGLLMEDDLGEEFVTSGKNIYNMNIGRFLSLSKCCIDFANTNMEACTPHHEEWMPGRVGASEFFEHVNPQIRGSHSCMSLKNKREQFYQHSGITAELLEEESEYYMYLIKSSLLKAMSLKEIRKVDTS